MTLGSLRSNVRRHYSEDGYRFPVAIKVVGKEGGGEGVLNCPHELSVLVKRKAPTFTLPTISDGAELIIRPLPNAADSSTVGTGGVHVWHVSKSTHFPH